MEVGSPIRHLLLLFHNTGYADADLKADSRTCDDRRGEALKNTHYMVLDRWEDDGESMMMQHAPDGTTPEAKCPRFDLYSLLGLLERWRLSLIAPLQWEVSRKERHS